MVKSDQKESSAPSKVHVHFVIVNYRTPELTLRCLESCANERGDSPYVRVVVVDNASNDGSLALLVQEVREREWTNWIDILESPRNGGFAYGCNRGIRHIQRSGRQWDYVWLLNPDAILLRGSVQAMQEFFSRHPKAGVAGSLILNRDQDPVMGPKQKPSPLTELARGAKLGILDRLVLTRECTSETIESPMTCDWLSGSSLAINARCLLEVGLLDEGYFLYFEEVEYCCRSWRNGWQVWFVPDSKVIHDEGASTGVRGQSGRPPVWYASRDRFLRKAYGSAGLLLSDALFVLASLSRAFRQRIGLAKEDGSLPLRDCVDLLRSKLRSRIDGMTLGSTQGKGRVE